MLRFSTVPIALSTVIMVSLCLSARPAIATLYALQKIAEKYLMKLLGTVVDMLFGLTILCDVCVAWKGYTTVMWIADVVEAFHGDGWCWLWPVVHQNSDGYNHGPSKYYRESAEWWDELGSQNG